MEGVHSLPLCACPTSQENTPPPGHMASVADLLRTEAGGEGEGKNRRECSSEN